MLDASTSPAASASGRALDRALQVSSSVQRGGKSSSTGLLSRGVLPPPPQCWLVGVGRSVVTSQAEVDGTQVMVPTNAVATRTEVPVRGVVRRRRAFRGLKTSSKEIGRNAHAHSFWFPRTMFSACQPKDAHQNLGRSKKSCCPCRPTGPISSSEKSRHKTRRDGRRPRRRQLIYLQLCGQENTGTTRNGLPTSNYVSFSAKNRMLN